MRNWKYLMMSLALTGATATFTGCIDTDEPNGISELRSAKSELIKAQAALKLADVEFRNAETAMELAKVEGQKIANQAAELLVKKEQLELDLLTEVNDAKIKAELEKIEQERAKLAETHKATMLSLETATAKAQESYDNAMKAIEAAKKLISADELVVLNKALSDLGTAKSNLTIASNAVKTAQETLLGALKTQTAANLEKDLTHKVKEAEAGLEAKKKVVAEIEELLTKDVATTNWENEVAELKDYVVELEVEEAEAKAQKKRLEINHASDLANVEALEEAYEDANTAEIELADYEKSITNSYVISVLGTDEYAYTGGEFTNEEYLEESGVAVTILEQIEAWMEDVEDKGIVSDEAYAQAQIDRTQKNTARTAAVNAHTPNVTAWTTALNAYKANPDNFGDTRFTALMTASTDAFGTGANEPGTFFRLVAPTDEEVIDLVENQGKTYADFGTLGTRIAADLALKEVDELLAARTDFTALYNALEAQYKAVEKIANDNKAAVAAAEKAWKDAETAYDDLFEDVNDIIADYGTLISEFEDLIDILESNIEKFLDYDGNGYDNYADFEQALKDALLAAEEGVVTAEGTLATAKQNLALFKEGRYTELYAVKIAEEGVELAVQDYNLKKSIYDNTYIRVQEVISIILGE